MKYPHCKKEIEDTKWIAVPKLNIEIESKVHDHNMAFEDVKVPKGYRLLDAHEALTVANNEELSHTLNLKSGKNDFWIQQYDKNWAASLYYDYEQFHIYCNSSMNNNGRSRTRGVLFCRDLKGAQEE
ncbi:MAG: hypothetical protein ABIB71_08190 [Candidatus Woesearchaeota archaeon]